MQRTWGLAALALGTFLHLPHSARGSDAEHASNEVLDPQHFPQREPQKEDQLFSLSRESLERREAEFFGKSPSTQTDTSLVEKKVSRNFSSDPKDVYETILQYFDTHFLLEARTINKDHNKAISLYLTPRMIFSFDCSKVKIFELFDKSAFARGDVQHVYFFKARVDEHCKLASFLGIFLNLQTLKLRSADLKHFWASHTLPTTLTSLDIGLNDIKNSGLAYLEGLTNLISLNLRDNLITSAGLVHLSSITNLTSLNLRGNLITSAGLAHLSSITNLTSLNLQGNLIMDAGMPPLETLTNLAELELESTDETELTYGSLSFLTALTNLSELNLSFLGITDESLGNLSQLANLTSLNLGYNWITDPGLAHLMGLSALTKLDLSKTKITDNGLSFLTALKNLTSLNLRYNWITDPGLAHLTGLSALTKLGLSKTKITDDGLSFLTALKNLTLLTSPDTFTKDAEEILRQHLPRVHVERSRSRGT